jgi:hypothetical protein
MASNALVRVTNNTSTRYGFSVDIAKPVKFVCQLILPASVATEVELETLMPLLIFDKGFQNLVAAGSLSLAFNFLTSAGVWSTSRNYLANVRKFLAATGVGWLTV